MISLGAGAGCVVVEVDAVDFSSDAGPAGSSGGPTGRIFLA